MLVTTTGGQGQKSERKVRFPFQRGVSSPFQRGGGCTVTIGFCDRPLSDDDSISQVDIETVFLEKESNVKPKHSRMDFGSKWLRLDTKLPTVS